MDLEQFISQLRELDAESISRAADEIDVGSCSAAAEIDWWTARIEIDRYVRMRRVHRSAATAATRASTAVTVAAKRAGMDTTDPRVVSVARAAADMARAITAGTAVDRLLTTCPHLLAAA